MNFRLSIKLILLLMLFLSQVDGQTGNFTQYSIMEGLPQSQVYAVCQDSQGMIWAGTQGGGIARFDGQKFEIYNEKNGLLNRVVNCLHTSSDRKIWVGTPSGFQFFTGRQTVSARLDVWASCFAEYDRHMYTGTASGLYMSDMDLKVTQPVHFSKKLKNVSVNDLEVVSGKLWIATEQGLFILDSKTGISARVAGLPYPNIHRILKSNDGFVWLAVVGSGLIKVDYQGRITGQATDPLLSHVTDLIIKKDGTVWASTESNGIIILDECTGSTSQITEHNGLRTGRIRCMMKDSWDNIWVGTSGEGMLRHTSQPFDYYNLYDNGINGNRIYSLTADTANGIWISVNQGMLVHYNGYKFVKQDLDSLEIHTKIKSLAKDDLGRIWIGTEGEGLYLLDSNRILNVTGQTGITDLHIVQIVPGHDGGVWVATFRSGLMYIKVAPNNGSIEYVKFSSDEGVPDRFVNCIAFDKKKNRLWFGCRNGKAGYISDKSEVTVFDHTDGLPGEPVKVICSDTTGRVFFAVSYHGVYTFDDSKLPSGQSFFLLDSRSFDYSRNIYSMTFDKAGSLWLGCENGTYKCTPDSTFKGFKVISHYDADAGFLGLENCHNSICTSPAGDIWFGTLNGLVRYRNESFSPAASPPRISMEDVLLYNNRIEETPFRSCFTFDDKSLAKGRLPYNQNHLSVIFRAIHLNYPDKIKYRYTLSGSDENWSSWSDQTRINFSSLPPGAYHFKVESTYDEKLISRPTGFQFTINQPFWQTLWFKSLAILIFAGLITSIFLIREKSIRDRAVQQKAVLEQENKLLSLEQKALQLQMNPHFIFNSLNSIQSLVAGEKTEEARKQIQNFAKLMRSLLNNSKKSYIPLSEEINYLDEYLRMEQFCQKNSFTYSVNLHDIENPVEIQLPSMLIQPYVENAVIHGISHLVNRDGIIAIDFNQENDHIICEITDNGVGRLRAGELSASRQKGHVSMGMAVTRQRLSALNANDPKSETVTDLIDPQGKPAGTMVKIKIPVTHSY